MRVNTTLWMTDERDSLQSALSDQNIQNERQTYGKHIGGLQQENAADSRDTRSYNGEELPKGKSRKGWDLIFGNKSIT